VHVRTFATLTWKREKSVYVLASAKIDVGEDGVESLFNTFPLLRVIFLRPAHQSKTALAEHKKDSKFPPTSSSGLCEGYLSAKAAWNSSNVMRASAFVITSV
jgi:hypothetical protein